MAFCEYCGKEIAEGEQCSCRTASAVQPPEKKSMKGLIIAVAAVVVIAVGVIAAFMLFSSNYKTPINQLTKALNSKQTDVDSLVCAALPDFAASSYKKAVKILKTSDDIADAFDSMEEELEGMYDEMTDEYGSSWKFKFDISDKERIEKEDLEDIADSYASLYDSYFEDICEEIDEYDKYDYEDMAEYLGISSSKAKDFCKILVNLMGKFKEPAVSDGYVLSGRFVITGEDNETLEKSDKMSVQVIKLNGDWTIDYLGLISEMGYGLSGLLWQVDDYLDNIY